MTDTVPALTTPPAVPFSWVAALLRRCFAPEYLHLELADPGKPTLFVGNHSLSGVLDVLLFSDGLYRERGIVLRSLADRNHFKLPGPTGRSGAAQAVAGGAWRGRCRRRDVCWRPVIRPESDTE